MSRICESCGAEYSNDSDALTCSAQYPDLFHPEIETSCGGRVLPIPKSLIDKALDLKPSEG